MAPTFARIPSASVTDAPTSPPSAGKILPKTGNRISPKEFPDSLPEGEPVPASLSPRLLQGLLRKKLGFNGLIVTDSTCMVGFSCAMERRRAVPYAIEAGCDMFLFNKDLAEDYRFMAEGVQTGILSEERLTEALTRILALKASLGLWNKAPEERVPGEESLSVIGCPEHRQWARECADRSITLVKDTQGLLPLDPVKHRRVLLEVLGDFPGTPRILAKFCELLSQNGFETEIYEHEDFGTANFSVEAFRGKYDLVLYLANVENTSNMVTNRLSWFTFWGNGNNVPWFVKERPVLFVSLANPYHLVDVPMIKTYINCYGNSDDTLELLMEKLLGRSDFKGTSPSDPFCGKKHLRY